MPTIYNTHPKISYSRYPAPRKQQPPAKKPRARARNKKPNLKSGPSHPYTQTRGPSHPETDARSFPGDSSPPALSFGSRQDGDSHCRRPSSPPPRRPSSPLPAALGGAGRRRPSRYCWPRAAAASPGICSEILNN